MTTPDRVVWPYPDIVRMTAHAGSGQWRKRHRGRDYYFGPLADPASALTRWRAEWPLIEQGLPLTTPAVIADDAATVKQLCDAFLTAKEDQVDRGDRVRRTFEDYRWICGRVADTLGRSTPIGSLGPQDFARLLRAAGHLSPLKRGHFVTKTRTVFRWGKDNGIIATMPTFGSEFRGPSAKMVRRHRNQQAAKVLTAAQVHKLIERADPRMKAMLLLGINGGFGNTDVASLPRAVVDAKAKLIVWPRPKTEVTRRVPLWPETLAAIAAVSELHPELVFANDRGQPLIRRGTDEVAVMAGELIEAAGLGGGGVGFYWLRRTFATVASETGDDHARHIIMGHIAEDVPQLYIQRFPADRLRRVVDHVRSWLFKRTPARSKGRKPSAGAAAASRPASQP